MIPEQVKNPDEAKPEVLRDEIAYMLNWYSEPYRDWHRLSERDHAMWRCRADDIIVRCRR